MKFSPLTVSTAVAYFATNVNKVFGCGDDTNASFEEGNLNCWTATTTGSGGATVVSSAISLAISSIDPIYGTYAASIPGGCKTNKLSRTFTSPISGVAKWDGGESSSFYNDNGLIKVIEDDTILFKASIAQYGGFGESAWLPFQYASPSGSPFTLEVSSTNAKDCIVTSNVLFDLDDFAIDANGPYLVLAGSSTVLEGTSNKLTADIGATWSLDCPSATSGPSAASLASFGDVSSLSTTLSIPSDVEPELCTLTLQATSGTITKSSSTQIIVANPSAGFVTGGGYIISPEGAYAPDTNLIGPATFGFVSKYNKGKSIPSGETDFKFDVANLHFMSTSYEWLVITGSDCAKYKGEGTLNESSGYGFMLTACDKGEPSINDTFRIKIWDIVGGNTIYDNAMGADDDSYEGTVITGGNIQIHQPKEKKGDRFLRA